MPLPQSAREELEGRIEVLRRDAKEAREDAARQRTIADNYQQRSHDYEQRAAELNAILGRAFPEPAVMHSNQEKCIASPEPMDEGGMVPGRGGIYLDVKSGEQVTLPKSRRGTR